MTQKEFLQQAFVAHKEIEVRLEQITTLQALATQTTTIIRHAPGGSNVFRSRVETAVIQIQEHMTHLADEVARLIEVTKKISSAIELVPNANERAILEYRYLCFFSWQQISALMKTGVSNVWKIHRRAIKNFRGVK